MNILVVVGIEISQWSFEESLEALYRQKEKMVIEQKLTQFVFEQIRLENVPERNPCQNVLKSQQRLSYYIPRDCLLVLKKLNNRERNKAENILRRTEENLLQFLVLKRRSQFAVEFEDFLREQFQYIANVLIENLRLHSCHQKVINCPGPGIGKFQFNYLD